MLPSQPANHPSIHMPNNYLSFHFLPSQQILTHIASNMRSKPSMCKGTHTIFKQLAMPIKCAATIQDNITCNK